MTTVAERERQAAKWLSERTGCLCELCTPKTKKDLADLLAVCANEALERAENAIVYFFDTHQGEILKTDPVCHTLVGRIRKLKAEG